MDRFASVFDWPYVLGFLVVLIFAVNKFDEPTFDSRQPLPQTLDPLRCFFLNGAYSRARAAYVALSLIAYTLLAMTAPAVAALLPDVAKNVPFPDAAYALLVALLLVGLVPNTGALKIDKIEEMTRRLIHRWYFVPSGVERAVQQLKYAPFNPTAEMVDVAAARFAPAIFDRQRASRSNGRITGSPQDRWFRATVLVATLTHTNVAGIDLPNNSAFAPFDADLNAISLRHSAIAKDIKIAKPDVLSDTIKSGITEKIDDLLARIYAYIVWGTRTEVYSEEDLNRRLASYGFELAVHEKPTLFNIMAPAVGAITGIVFLFWILVDVSKRMGLEHKPEPAIGPYDAILSALFLAVTAGSMYGFVAYVALRMRGNGIEQWSWEQRFGRPLFKVACWCGAAVFGVVLISTAFSPMQKGEPWWSSVALGLKAAGYFGGLIQNSPQPTGYLGSLFQNDPPLEYVWKSWAARICGAISWTLVGATIGGMLLMLAGTKLQENPSKVQSGILAGVAASLAVMLASLFQDAATHAILPKFGGGAASDLGHLDLSFLLLGIVGFACGFILGYLVPAALRREVLQPQQSTLKRSLDELIEQATSLLGSSKEGATWVFLPHHELGGITPAEAVQYTSRANYVKTLLRRKARILQPTTFTIHEGLKQS